MDERRIGYTAEEIDMVGLLVLPDGDDARPGVLVSHEGPGQSDHERTIARRLAELGYVAFALDYNGGGEPMTDRDAMFLRVGTLIGDQDQTRRIGRAGLEQLLAAPRVDHDRIAAIGFCFGGTMSLELGRAGEDVKAIVGFHAGLGSARPEDARNISGKVLVCIGADDPIIPPAQRAAFEQEMRDGGVDWRMDLYGGVQHSFTNPYADSARLPGIVYDEVAAERSWRAMLEVFGETIGPPAAPASRARRRRAARRRC
jgi:dienelactone hydrolase